MNKSIAFGIAFLVTLVLSATGWWFLPSLQSSKRTVDIEASIQIERARRLLHQYDAGLNYKSLLSDQLGSYVDEIDPNDLSEDVEDEYQRLHETLWDSYPPMDWDRGSPKRANYGNLPGQIREGLAQMAGASAKNERFLDQALSAVDRALAVSAGNDSARVHPEANRLKAVALYHKGLTRWIEAQVLRREADQYRRELTTLASDAATAAAASARIADSGIADDIETLVTEADDLQASIDEHVDDAEEVEDVIADLEERLADQVTRRGDARSAIERLKAQGADPSDPDAAGRFADELTTLGKAYRDANREAQALEHGTYKTAELEDRGDYLTGRYVDTATRGDPELRLGLDHFRDKHRILSASVANEEQRLDAVRESIASLEALKDSMAGEADRSAERVSKATDAAAETFAELNRIESDAFTIEEDALNQLDRAASSAKSAAGFARQWVSDANSRTRDLSPEAKARSAFDERGKAHWVAAFVAAQEADARLAKAWIHYARYRSASQDAARHWTFTAPAAGTTYLLALFGHEDYVADTIETYRSAISGRENDRFAATFVARLNKLENR